MNALPTTITEAIADPKWWQQWFPHPDEWAAWRAFLAAVFALPMTEAELVIYRECTGRREPPAAPAREVWVPAGRRAGKSRIAALMAAWLAIMGRWSDRLAPGERATIMILAADRKQARTAMRYLRSLFVDHRGLRQLVEGETQESLEFRNRVTVEVTTASFRTTRGYSVAAVICDEIAFWQSDEGSANPAAEIIRSLRPAMMRGALLMAVSSPYARRGPLWNAYRKHYGKDGDLVLVWKAATRVMNPTVLQSDIDEAYENDPASAAAEYGAEFRSDIENYVSREVIDAATVVGRYELPPASGTTYCAFVDPSGGSADSMTLAIAHRGDGDRLIVDAIRERRPPFSPDDCVLEFTALLKSYGVRSVTGDRYAGEWPRERFRVHGIEYVVAEKPKSDIYRDMLPLLNSGRVELLDIPRLTAQLCGLERRTARSGKDSIDHAPGAHDDVCNAVAGVCGLVGEARPVNWSAAGSIVAALQRPNLAFRPGMRPSAAWGARGRQVALAGNFEDLPAPSMASLGTRRWDLDPT